MAIGVAEMRRLVYIMFRSSPGRALIGSVILVDGDGMNSGEFQNFWYTFEISNVWNLENCYCI
jgi:hypothetical protein